MKCGGVEVPEDEDELMMKLADKQLRADYRKSLGKESERRYLDLKIKEALRKRKK